MPLGTDWYISDNEYESLDWSIMSGVEACFMIATMGSHPTSTERESARGRSPEETSAKAKMVSEVTYLECVNIRSKSDINTLFSRVGNANNIINLIAFGNSAVHICLRSKVS